MMAIGLRRLYSSCINNEGFPGVLSEQHIQEMKEMDVQIPPTHAILEALGLIKAERRERTEEEGEDDQGQFEHSEAYWHGMRPDRPLMCHSPENDAMSVHSSHDTSTSQHSDDLMKVEDLDSLPTSATTLSSMPEISESGKPPIIMSQPTLPRQSDTEQYVRMMQYKYYVPSSDPLVHPTSLADTSTLTDTSLQDGLYGTMMVPHQAEDSSLSLIHHKSRLEHFPGVSLQTHGPHGLC